MKREVTLSRFAVPTSRPPAEFALLGLPSRAFIVSQIG